MIETVDTIVDQLSEATPLLQRDLPEASAAPLDRVSGRVLATFCSPCPLVAAFDDPLSQERVSTLVDVYRPVAWMPLYLRRFDRFRKDAKTNAVTHLTFPDNKHTPPHSPEHFGIA